ncbi:MAG TPA: D-alanine--D-alanine ligase [Gammaproteobacteria bacterium]|nr:D-alanine--D-alanine ligase [Gammaproteobacteria bacterium]
MSVERDPGRFGRVGVLLGGNSAEREVSLLSGGRVLEALLAAGVDAHPLDPREDGLAALWERRFDRCFLVLHGRGGEDGAMQGFLETLAIPYTGSGVLGSALAMDKLATKRIWRALGFPTPEWVAMRRGETPPADLFDRLGPVLAVKPAREGSTLGLSKVTRSEALSAALEAAFARDADVVIEPWIAGRELTASLLGEEALPLIHIEPAVDFYDYEAKYLSDATRYHCPSGLAAAEETRLRSLCRDAFLALGCSGWGRVDFIRDADGQSWLLEANTIPGMTKHSLVPMAARVAGTDFQALVLRILETSMTERADAR